MKPSEGKASHQIPKINASSSNLTQEENEAVFKLLGRRCQTLNTAVVQIYKTEGSAHSHWRKKHTGVLCFVKDSVIRSYFLRAYCLKIHELVWEHELYDSMNIIKPKPFLLTFEGQDGHVGLNFISEEECDSFYRAVRNTIETRNRRKTEKRSRPKSQIGQYPDDTEIGNIGLAKGLTKDNDYTVQLRNHNKVGTVTITPQLPTPTPQKNFFGKSSSSSSSKNEKRKVTKADISTPTNFIHVAHVGWNTDKGFDLVGKENVEMLNQFFAKAGISETQLKDRDTRAFIYEFIESNNVLESVKSESVSNPKAIAPAPPPPVPSRTPHSANGTPAYSQRSAPPPPPARQLPPPIPTTVPGSARAPAPPIRPPPINNIPPPPAPPSAAVAPPPPPPPPPISGAPPPPPPPMPLDIPTITTTNAPNETKAPSSLPVISDSRNALMESIRKGKPLRKVDTSTHSTGSGDSRSELMSEIRMGIELRPAQNRELSNRSSDEGAGGTDALADALRRALQERGRVIQSSDDESESSGNDDEWED